MSKEQLLDALRGFIETAEKAGPEEAVTFRLTYEDGVVVLAVRGEEARIGLETLPLPAAKA